MDVEKNVEDKTMKGGTLFTPKKILKILLLMCIIFVFCPMFLVSCAETTVEVDVMTVVEGLSMYDETVVEPHPIMLIVLIIPIVVLVKVLAAKIEAKSMPLWSLAVMIIDFYMWVKFRILVIKEAREYEVFVETTGWFYINIIVIALIIILIFSIISGSVQMETDLLLLLTGDNREVNHCVVFQKCPKCGGNIDSQARFCRFCGTKVNDVCPDCGTVLKEGTLFCVNCGRKRETELIEVNSLEVEKNE